MNAIKFNTKSECLVFLLSEFYYQHEHLTLNHVSFDVVVMLALNIEKHRWLYDYVRALPGLERERLKGVGLREALCNLFLLSKVDPASDVFPNSGVFYTVNTLGPCVGYHFSADLVEVPLVKHVERFVEQCTPNVGRKDEPGKPELYVQIRRRMFAWWDLMI